jgi:D-amino-acid dehydrogenase
VASYPELIGRLGPRAETGFAKVGMLFVAPEGRELEAATAALAAARDGGFLPPGSVTELAPREARRAFPYLRDDLAAVHLSETSRVNGEAVRLALLASAEAQGATLRSGAASLTADGTVTVGGGERIDADVVLVAAGAWSPMLLGDLLVAPQRGQIVHLEVPEDTAGLPVARPAGGDHYLLPFADHRIVVGATRETGAGFDPRITASGLAQVLGNALDVAPGLAGATVVDQRVGLRPASADGLPFLGEAQAGLWIATGMGAEGLTLGPYCGRLVADAILGRRLDVDLTPFRPQRTQVR